MTKEAALQEFYSQFGIPAYEENAVPDDAVLPYLTYTVTTGAFDDGALSLTCSLWYRAPWSTVNAKMREVATKVSPGGVMVQCDDGAIWLKRGTPFAQNMIDDTDTSVRRKYINMEAEYITSD